MAKLIFALVAVLIAPTVVFAQTDGGAVHGRVMNPNGTPASNVRVAAVEVSDGKRLAPDYPVIRGVTNADGQYRLIGLSQGRYQIIAGEQLSSRLNSNAFELDGSVTVRPEVESQKDILLPSAQSGVRVRGRLLGNPLDLKLQRVTLGNGEKYSSTYVDFDGMFTFNGVQPGTYQLSLDTPLLNWSSMEILVGDRDIGDIELRPEFPTPVAGRAITENGTPVPRLHFELRGNNGVLFARALVFDSLLSGMVSVLGWSDRPNDVVFTTHLPVGEYRIALKNLPEGYGVKSFTYGTTNLLESPLKLTGELQQLSIVFSAPVLRSRVSGRLIRDSEMPVDLSWGRVALESIELLTPVQALVDSDGRFEFSGVAPGIYRLQAAGIAWRLTVPPGGVRGIELRTSRIQSLREMFANSNDNLPRMDGSQRLTELREIQVVREVVDGVQEGGYMSFRSANGQDFTGWFDGPTLKHSLPDGDYKVSAWVSDDRYEVQSLTYGTADLSRELLRIGGAPTDILRLKVGMKRVKKLATVSGRVVGAEASALKDIRIVLSDYPPIKADLNDDGRFEFAGVPAGTHRIYLSNELQQIFGIGQTLVIEDADIRGLELRLPPSTKAIRGRIVMEDGVPLPLLAFTVRLNASSGSSYDFPRTLRFEDEPRDLRLEGGGRFTIQLPEGHHRLRVDAYPDNQYRVRSVRYGSRDLNNNLLEITSDSEQEIVVTVVKASGASWTDVRGRISGLENISEPVRVVLSATRTKQEFEVAPSADGSFRFPKVPSDTYTVRTIPRVAAMKPVILTVSGRATPPVNLQIPRRRTVRLNLMPSDGNPLPAISLDLRVNSNEAYTVVLPSGIALRTANESKCISDTCIASPIRTLGQPRVVSRSPDSRIVLMELPEGEYRVSRSPGASVSELESVTFGTRDLLSESLQVGAAPIEIVVRFRRK